MDPTPLKKAKKLRKNRNEYFKRYRKRNRKKITERIKSWKRKFPPEKKRTYQNVSNNRRRTRYNSDPKFKKYLDDRNLKNRRKVRKAIIDLLGGECKKCGFLDWRALQVDHIKGGGGKERREKGYRAKNLLLEIEQFPKKYQLLCANCNWIKRHENGEGVNNKLGKE